MRNTYTSTFKMEDTKDLQMNVLETVCLLASSMPYAGEVGLGQKCSAGERSLDKHLLIHFGET